MADSSTTAGQIPVLFLQGCWALHQLHKGIRLIPTRAIPMELLTLLSALAEPFLMADYTRASGRIPILFSGGYWAQRQLHAGIYYVPVASKLRISLSSVEGVLGSMLAEFYSMADCSTNT